MTLWQWLRARIDGMRARIGEPRARRTIIPPPPDPFDEVGRRLDIATRHTVKETRLLRIDGSELAERIRRNTRAGRDALEGKP